MIFIFMDLPLEKLIKLVKMAGVMHEADHAKFNKRGLDCKEE